MVRAGWSLVLRSLNAVTKELKRGSACLSTLLMLDFLSIFSLQLCTIDTAFKERSTSRSLPMPQIGRSLSYCRDPFPCAFPAKLLDGIA